MKGPPNPQREGCPGSGYPTRAEADPPRIDTIPTYRKYEDLLSISNSTSDPSASGRTSTDSNMQVCVASACAGCVRESTNERCLLLISITIPTRSRCIEVSTSSLLVSPQWSASDVCQLVKHRMDGLITLWSTSSKTMCNKGHQRYLGGQKTQP
ncbi:hypothetical protein LY76DRAFT_109075 [Colletotrichum caudatum]|nr:hypothetical protein LY76DRAFT_109075 [Colletotrichum caudatum]